KPGLNVHTIHAEMEGRVLARLFADLLQRLKEMGATFVTLAEAAAAFGKDAPARNLSMGEIPGRAGLVAIESEN
ncbi:MAG TPA: 4-deoxy-4-formamido-L-arabinose-phosphoundecaprenol deformylase, partial [Geobacteraceae bacterium]